MRGKRPASPSTVKRFANPIVHNRPAQKNNDNAIDKVLVIRDTTASNGRGHFEVIPLPFLIEHISEALLGLNILVFLAAGFLITIAFVRRRFRERYFRRIDALRAENATLVASVLDGKLEYKQGLETLRAVSINEGLQILELLLLEKRPEPARIPVLRQLCQDLGLVEAWQRQLNGIGRNPGRLGYLVRAAAANNLGIIRHHPSWPLLVKALDDPYPDVAAVAARSLAGIGEPESFQPLLNCLYDVVQNSSRQVSLRSIKMALVSFPLKFSSRLLPSLNHSNPRIRFLAVDIIRQMAERRAEGREDFALDARTFAPELSELFLSRLNVDENPDVRARSAPVIAYLADPRAASALLLLLGDKEWFVRLHAARALAKPKYISRANYIASRLCDTQWMVREAATRTLFSFGREGLSQLYDHALSTTDRYSKEQIADEIQRAGLIPGLLAQYAEGENGKEAQVIEQLVDLGKTSYMLEALEASSERNLRRKFLADFGRHSDPQIRSWVKGLAGGQPSSKFRRRSTLPDAAAPPAGRT
jgi:HEAT repeat protein